MRELCNDFRTATILDFFFFNCFVFNFQFQFCFIHKSHQKGTGTVHPKVDYKHQTWTVYIKKGPYTSNVDYTHRKWTVYTKLDCVHKSRLYTSKEGRRHKSERYMYTSKLDYTAKRGLTVHITSRDLIFLMDFLN